jgi:hypothetical protein
MYAENSEEVRRLVEADVYYTFEVSSVCFSRKSDDASLIFGGSGMQTFGKHGGRRRKSSK